MHLRFDENTETRFTDDGKYIEGYATRFNRTYYVSQEGFHERVNTDAFDKSLASGHPIESRYNHSPDHVLGRSDLGQVQCWNDGEGIRYKVRYNSQDPDHNKVKAKLDSGLIQGSSMAMIPTKVTFRNEDDKHVAIIHEAQLREVGPVNNPANIHATATVRSDSNEPTLKERYQEWLQREEMTKRILETADRLTI